MTNGPAPEGEAIDRLFDALSAGDAAAARACCTPDVVVWHSFDQVPHGIDAAVEGWTQFFAAFPTRRFTDVRRAAFAGGFVQQHLMVGVVASGKTLGWPVCVVVKLRDGRISRLDEYIDRAGKYEVSDGGSATPGLEPAAH